MYPLHAACIRDRFLPLDARRVHAAPAGHHPQTTVLCSRKPSFVLSDRLLVASVENRMNLRECV